MKASCFDGRLLYTLMNKNTEVFSTNKEFLVASSSDSAHKLSHMLNMYMYSLPKVSFITAAVYFL